MKKNIFYTFIAVCLACLTTFSYGSLGVSATNDSGVIGTTIPVTSGVTTLAKPSGLTLKTGRLSSNKAPYIKVTYKKVANAGKYQIAYKVAGGKLKYVTTTKLTYTFKNLTNSKKYYFKVKAVATNSAYKTGAFCSAKSQKTLAKYKFGKVKNLKVKGYQDQVTANICLKVTFNKVAVAKKYRIYYMNDEAKIWISRVVTTNYFKLVNAHQQSKFYVKVKVLKPNKYCVDGCYSTTKTTNTPDLKPIQEYCEKCGLPCGHSKGYCFKSVGNGTCVLCGKKVYAGKCHHCTSTAAESIAWYGCP